MQEGAGIQKGFSGNNSYQSRKAKVHREEAGKGASVSLSEDEKNSNECP